MSSRLIVALDTESREDTLTILETLRDKVWGFKLNSLFLQEGANICSLVHAYGCKLMLDLKLYDIPSTIQRSINTLRRYQAEIITVHMSADYEDPNPSDLAAVTVLTSFTCRENIVEMIENAVAHNYGYIVCSAPDLADKKVSEILKKSPVKVICPGIRMRGESKHDQYEVVDPAEAIKLGADLIIMGRSFLANVKEPTMMAATADQVNIMIEEALQAKG